MNGIFKPFCMIEKTHLLSVNSSHCSTKWANLPPTGMSGRGSTVSGKGWLSEFCGGRGKFRGGELFGDATPPGEILFITCRNGLSLCFRPIRLCLFRSRLFVRNFLYFKSSWRTERLLLLNMCIRRS